MTNQNEEFNHKEAAAKLDHLWSKINKLFEEEKADITDCIPVLGIALVRYLFQFGVLTSEEQMNAFTNIVLKQIAADLEQMRPQIAKARESLMAHIAKEEEDNKPRIITLGDL